MPRFPGGCCLPLQARACQFAIVLATSVLRPGDVIASKCLGFQSVVIFLLRLPVRRNLRPSNPARLKEFAGSSRFRRYCRILDRRILDRFQFFQPLQQEMLFACVGHGSAQEQATERNPAAAISPRSACKRQQPTGSSRNFRYTESNIARCFSASRTCN
jgi:hypothetical protein